MWARNGGKNMTGKYKVWDNRMGIWARKFTLTQRGQLIPNREEYNPDVIIEGRFEKFFCTDIKDSKGIEIYEGDIVKGLMASGMGLKSTKYKMVNFEVYWNNFMNCWSLKLLNKTSYRFYPHFSKCEIIGQIRTNPELLIKE